MCLDEACRSLVWEGVCGLCGQRRASSKVNWHLAGHALWHTLLGALGVALVRWTGTLGLVHLRALLQAATNAVDSALAWLGLRRK